MWVQPGGMEPDAENLEHLPGGREYYLRLTRGNNAAWIDRYVHAKYGEDPGWHRRLAIVQADFSRRRSPGARARQADNRWSGLRPPPCSLICQGDHKGRLLVLEEVLAEDIGLELHLTRSLKPVLWGERYMGKMMCAVGDPSGTAKSSHYEETSFDLMQRLGVPAFPAVTNDVEARIRAVEQLLLQQRDGGPAIVIDGSRCPKLVRATRCLQIWQVEDHERNEATS